VFGLSFFEIVVILIVGIVVLGPRRLPEMMRTAGQWVSKLRRLSTDLRAQSGIDDLIRQEGLENEIQELRSLSRINVIDTLMAPAASSAAAAAVQRATVSTPKIETKSVTPKPQPLREREYPVIGCDAYGALADDVAPKILPPKKDERDVLPSPDSASEAS
jgi:sec-independent protein translocase protein TatB